MFNGYRIACRDRAAGTDDLYSRDVLAKNTDLKCPLHHLYPEAFWGFLTKFICSNTDPLLAQGLEKFKQEL